MCEFNKTAHFSMQQRAPSIHFLSTRQSSCETNHISTPSSLPAFAFTSDTACCRRSPRCMSSELTASVRAYRLSRSLLAMGS